MPERRGRKGALPLQAIPAAELAHPSESLQDRPMPWSETYRARGTCGFLLLACGFGCGGKAGDEPQGAEPSGMTPRTDTSPASTDSTPQRPSSAPSLAPAQMPPPATAAPALIPERDGSQIAPKNVLMANCGACHGPDAPPAASGGIRFINDFTRLVATGLVVPLSSASSPLIRVMRDGTMPPPGAGYPAVQKADIEIVAQYIDNPRYWPTPALDGEAQEPAVDAGADDSLAPDAGG
jgi:mono/diheme cytochrome c family protein